MATVDTDGINQPQWSSWNSALLRCVPSLFERDDEPARRHREIAILHRGRVIYFGGRILYVSTLTRDMDVKNQTRVVTEELSSRGVGSACMLERQRATLTSSFRATFVTKG
jgi:hypothetical protein